MSEQQLQTVSIDTSKMISVLNDKINELIIDNDESMALSSDMAKQLSQLTKKVDAEEKSYTKPLNDTLKKLREVFKGPKEKIDAITCALKGKQAKYLLDKKRKEEAEAAKRKAEFEANTLEIAENLEKNGLNEAAEELVNVASNMQTKSVKVQSVGNLGTTFIKRSIDFEVTDLSKVDISLLMINDKAVKSLISDLKDKFTKEAEEKGLKSDLLSDYVYKQFAEGEISGIKIVINESVQTR